ncbi:unnamed protein product [Aphanomyces euteiches]
MESEDDSDAECDLDCDIDSQIPYRVFVVCSVGLLLVLGYYNIPNVLAMVRATYHRTPFSDGQVYPRLYQGSHDVTPSNEFSNERCRVQFVFTGSKSNYKSFPTLQSWMRFADPTCPIEFLRSNHPFLGQITVAEARVIGALAFQPILQADMLKLLAIYYLGGLVVDLDVQAIKPFPQAWADVESPLAFCDVVLGIEADCYDDICVKNFVRKGQIQNWAMFARQPRSPFLGELLEFIVEKYDSMAPLDENVSIQEVAGSGPITDFVQIYGNFSHPFYNAPTSQWGWTLASDPSSVLRIQKHHEEVCVVGSRYTGGGCLIFDEIMATLAKII